MHKKQLSMFIVFFAALFIFQSFDILPGRSNPKTCCGRAVCLCKHAPGAFCPMRHHMKGLHKAAESTEDNSKSSLPQGVTGFTKAPCASDTPKTMIPTYIKDFLIPEPAGHFAFIPQGIVSCSSFDAVPQLAGRGIEHPPRIF